MTLDPPILDPQTPEPPILGFPFPDRPGTPLDPEQVRCFRDRPLVPVRLSNGREALLVTRHPDVKTVLADPRFSREAYAAHPLFARSTANLALVTSDPPTHTRRRRAVTAPFTPRRAEADRGRVEAICGQTLDRVETAGSPVDLVAEFCVPFSFAVILDVLGLPFADFGRLHPWAEVLTSAGRFTPAEIDDAQRRIRGYFAGQVAERRAALAAGRPGEGVLSELVAADTLPTEEIVTFGFGVLMAGGDTTANHLALCLSHLVGDPELQGTLRCDPAAVGPAVEELLRWAWVGHTGGQPHVACEDVPLAGTVVRAGQVVVPLTDAANRDPAVFDDPDTFRADRSPNPHLGLGHGRHMCLGAPLARIELQVALTALTARFVRLELAVSPEQVAWRGDMFVRGPWRLPVRWEK